MSDLTYWILWAFLAIIVIIGVWWIVGMLLEPAYGQTQNATPPKPVTSPPNPTPTTPNPNFQYLPQKAYVLPFAPENGIPNTTPLPTPLSPTSLQPVPVAPVQNTIGGFDLNQVMGYLSALGAAGVGVKAWLTGKKTDKVEQVTRENSVQIVKGTKVHKAISDQVYQNMSDGGESIHDKPEIKLENLNKNIDEATETTAKA